MFKDHEEEWDYCSEYLPFIPDYSIHTMKTGYLCINIKLAIVNTLP